MFAFACLYVIKREMKLFMWYGIGRDWKPLEGECVIVWDSLVFAFAYACCVCWC